MVLLKALHSGKDWLAVAEVFGMDAKQARNAMGSLVKMGLVGRTQEAPAENAPAFIKHRNVYTLTPMGGKVMGELDRV